MRRVATKVTDAEAKERLIAYREKRGYGPHAAATLADVIWPDTKWVAAQGAGAAASRVLKRLGCVWHSTKRPIPHWGWMITFTVKKNA